MAHVLDSGDIYSVPLIALYRCAVEALDSQESFVLIEGKRRLLVEEVSEFPKCTLWASLSVYASQLLMGTGI